ncbi:MAG: PEP/pyruvate-binding domain-containing protein [Myxococcota bacterium]|nr:PEP/pyruvate-binding domain-containing protein [Myxococcota bacterium]
MPSMVREILLIASLYDSFILEEDGRFSDELFGQYVQLNLRSPPRLTRASTGAEGLDLLRRRSFDLVVLTTRIPDMPSMELAKRVSEDAPRVPVVHLSFDAGRRLLTPKPGAASAVARTFVWKGDNRLLLVLVKSIEDMLNVAHDTREGMVRVIILVEDSPAEYSSYLTLLYREIMEQTQYLVVDSLNQGDRLRRMRARPKILLATTYEEGVAFFDQYRDCVLGMICDASIPREGVIDDVAGLSLISHVHDVNPRLPVLLQSADSEREGDARDLGITFADKKSPELLHQIQDFVRSDLGFGEFVFRGQSREEIARAGTMQAMIQALGTIPGESLVYHAERNQFSNWLMARGEFPLATALKQQTVEEFDGSESLRDHLLESFQTFLDDQQRGRITEFSREADPLARDFVRLGGGSLGGKGRSLAFLYSLITRSDLREKYPGVSILVPRTTAVCTDEFERFLESNQIREQITPTSTDAEVADIFLQSRISDEVHDDLQAMLEEVRYPLAVRSSSLLEDSHLQPFAGVYSTFMLPNNDPSMRVRLRQLRRAIKLVYASTYFTGSRAYMRAMQHREEEEKMAVLIQRLVGTENGERFYPTFSGVAQSYNYYPIRYMEPEDGIAHVALGLGRTVVEGGQALRFSPVHPHVLPQMSTPDDILRNSQRDFFAVDMSQPRAKITRDEEGTLQRPSLVEAEEDGALQWVGSTYDGSQGRVHDGIDRPGARVVTFAPVLKHDGFPLAAMLKDLLALGREAMGCPVDMEFAVNLDVPEGKLPEFAVLQLRPLATQDVPIQDEGEEGEAGATVRLKTERSLGNGVMRDIRDIVYVSPDDFDPRETLQIAQEVGEINAELAEQARPYLLIGPGRWGTSDRFLGIPVSWMDVSAARVIVELAVEGFDVDPSHGTHFFHNITSLRVGYLSVDDRKEGESLDREWLDALTVERRVGSTRHIRLDEPLVAHLDGRTGQGTVVHDDAGLPH